MDDISSIAPLPAPSAPRGATPRGVARRWIGSIAVVGALVGVGALTACGSDDTTREASAPATSELEGLVRPEPLQVGEATLPEVDGTGTATPFAFRAEPDELLFVAFGYTHCPDVCPTTLFDIRKALLELGDDADRVAVAFATVDPERDTDQIVAEYLGSFVTDGHPLRTPDREDLRTVEDVFGISSQVVEGDDGRIDVAHTARSFVIDDTGTVVVEWAFGTSWEAMAGDLRLLLAERTST